MAIFVGAGEVSAANGFGATRPAGVVAGDTLFALVGGASAPAAPTAPAGWTLVSASAGVGGDGGRHAWLYTKTATGSEPAGYDFSRVGVLAVVVGYRDLGAVVAAAVTVDATGDNAWSFPAVTATATNLLVMFGYAAQASITDIAPPVLSAERLDTSPAAAADVFFVADKSVGAGPTGSPGATHNGVASPAVLFSVAMQDTNVPPNAPALIAPADGSTIDRNITNRFQWDFSDPNAGDLQSKYDLRYRIVGDPTWTTLTASVPQRYRDVAGGTFAAGDYEWQVRTYDSVGLDGPWMASKFFTAGDPPTVTITYPADEQTVNQAETVTWSAPDQESYQLRRVADDGGAPDEDTVYADTGEVPGPSVRQLDVEFATNGRVEHLQVRVRKSGLWSTWASVSVDVDYTPPTTPSLTLTADLVTGSLLVGITNPDPGDGDTPPAVHNDVYVNDGTGEERRATKVAVNGSWRYWTPVSGRDYSTAIRVVAVAANGTTSSSQ